MKKNLLLIYLISFSFCIYGQIGIEKISLDISAYVYDYNTNKPLIYASVYNLNSKKGTVTNGDGFFRLFNNQKNDIIEVSFIGYKTIRINTNKDIPIKINLHPKSLKLSEAVIIANDPILFKLISKVKNKKYSSVSSAKTYFFLETYADGNLSELVENYYNGEYDSYDLKTLNYKKGRIGNKPFGNRQYLSFETSKVFYLHQIFNSSYIFPENPFNFKYRELKNKYDLVLLSKFMDNGNKIFEIHFRPKQAFSRELFEGTVWLDSTNSIIQKINLEIDNSKIHPLKPTGHIKSILSQDMYISL